ncbi:MAG: hypothetical protein JXA90_11425, partial [Planctomycetes bacterium]|nr:hypothetical protein [Planctomycetota bacterium]
MTTRCRGRRGRPALARQLLTCEKPARCPLALPGEKPELPPAARCARPVGRTAGPSLSFVTLTFSAALQLGEGPVIDSG